MRAFIAINSENYELQLPEAKLTKTKSYHLTLKFLGEIDPDLVPKIKEALATIKFQPFTITTNHIGVFPNEKYIKVVWVGLENPEPVIKLQQQVDAALKPFFKPEKNFHPHITLARVKYIEDKEKFINDLKKVNVEKEFPVKEIKLIKSTLTPEGPMYEEL